MELIRANSVPDRAERRKLQAKSGQDAGERLGVVVGVCEAGVEFWKIPISSEHSMNERK
jgi:hypothetical protein